MNSTAPSAGDSNEATGGTKAAIVEAAIETLKTRGFAGASAREIAKTRQLQSGADLLPLRKCPERAARGAGPRQRASNARVPSAFEAAEDLSELAALAGDIYREDLENGYVTILGEMVAGAVSDADLGREVVARIQPWLEMVEDKVRFLVAGSLFEPLIPSRDIAFAIVALYLGVDMLSHLDQDRARGRVAARARCTDRATCAGTTPNKITGEAMSRQRTGLDLVTGAFSYSGAHIAQRLLESGRQVRTLTFHPDRDHILRERVEAVPFRFDEPVALARTLEGVDTLYNTYWVRFDHGDTSFDSAVANSRTLFHAARRAGVRRIVHLSIANPSVDSPLAYYRGKALVERALGEVGLPFAIVRPTWIFGGAPEILANNIAWILRRMPIFPIPGDGSYRVQPIHIDDLVDICVEPATPEAT